MNFLQYEVVGPSASVPIGTVMQLTKDQRRRRLYGLDKDEDGNDIALQSLVFKAGETVLVLEPLPRSDLWLLKTEIAKAEPSEDTEEEFNPLNPFDGAGDGDQEEEDGEEGEEGEEANDVQGGKPDLSSMSLKDLNRIARGMGLSPHHFAGKSKLIEMIESAEAEG